MSDQSIADGTHGDYGFARLRALSATALHRIADWIAPPQCLSCAIPVEAPCSLCASCWLKLELIEEPCCDRLGLPFPYDQGEGSISAAAAADPPAWDRARAAVAFDEASRGIVHALKYRDRHEASLFMARLMTRAGQKLLRRANSVVPVPLHRLRLWQRRFNQSALLAARIARASGAAFRPELLERVKSTRSQVGLDHTERRRNVRRAFAVPQRQAPEIYGKSIVLIDDVLTTGATAAACASALRKAGAARVDVLVFALVLDPRRLHI